MTKLQRKLGCKLAFLVSDENWRDVLGLIPLAIWTEKGKTGPTYIESDKISKSPVLIYHKEPGKIPSLAPFDADSILYFFQQYLDKLEHDVDQSFEDGEEDYELAGDSWLAQPFIPQQPVLSKVSVKVKKIVRGEDLVVSIRSEINGPDLASITLPSSQVNSKYGLVTAELAEYLLVKVGTPYYLVLKVSKPITKAVYKWQIELGNGYLTGELLQDGKSIGAKANFKTYFPTSFLVVVDDTPQKLSNLLTSLPQTGAGLDNKQIHKISSTDYLSLWDLNSVKEIVVSSFDSYESGLMASVFASHLHVPILFIDNKNKTDFEKVLQGRKVHVVKPISRNIKDYVKSLAESVILYTLSELEQEYVLRTKTNKIILVNPTDWNIKINEELETKKNKNKIYELYSRTSLAAPILAAARQEVIIQCPEQKPTKVVKFFQNKITSFKEYVGSIAFKVEYLTIVSAPNAVPMTINVGTLDKPDYIAADSYTYANLDNDSFVELAVGRIFGMTLSDTSSYIARSVFYPQLPKATEEPLFLATTAFPEHVDAVNAFSLAFKSVGYIPSVIVWTDHTEIPSAEVWKNRDLIVFQGHGQPEFGGIYYSNLPELKNTFVITESCSIASFDIATNKHSLFAANVIRQGGIGLIGATDTTGYANIWDFLSNLYTHKDCLGKSFQLVKNAGVSYLLGENKGNLYFKGNKTNDYPHYLLIGDPLLKPIIPHTFPKPESKNIGINKYVITAHNLYLNLSTNVVKFLSTLPQRSWTTGSLIIVIGNFPKSAKFKEATIESNDLELFGSKTTSAIIWNVENNAKHLWIYFPALYFKPELNGKFNKIQLTLTLKK